jgi:hypothetical protein
VSAAVRRSAEAGFALTLVLATFMLVAVIGLGALSVVMSDLHGAIANQMAMRALSAAEGGVNHGVAQLAARATLLTPSDERYGGERDDIELTGANGERLGTFHVTVRCAYPAGAVPPACQDNPETLATDERNLRVITSAGFVPQRPGRARREIVATVRRYTVGPGDTGIPGLCGRDRVELGPDVSIVADVGSNGDVILDGTLRPRRPLAPSAPMTVEAIAPEGSASGFAGTYTWRMAFVDARGEQSGGGPVTLPVLLANQVGRLTNIPAGDAGVTRRRIYRSLPNAPRGPWFLVAEIADNATQEFVDTMPDEGLRIRMAGTIDGAITAGGKVTCATGCEAQAGGTVASHVRDVICPNFLPPPSQPGARPVETPIIQTALSQTLRWSSLRVEEGEQFTIETLSTLAAEIHIHVTSLVLERGATLAVTGAGTVYFHVSGSFVLGEDAVFGAADLGRRLLAPSDRIQVMVGARDSTAAGLTTASVRFTRHNRVSALVFAPDANIVIDRPDALRGGLYGKTIRLSRAGDVLLDPVEGMSSERVGVRSTPYQYLLRWYDNPNPGP